MNFIQFKTNSNRTALVNLDDISCILPYSNGEGAAVYFRGLINEHFITKEPFEVIVAKLKYKDIIRIIEI